MLTLALQINWADMFWWILFRISNSQSLEFWNWTPKTLLYRLTKIMEYYMNSELPEHRTMEQITLCLFLPRRCTDLTWIKDIRVCYTPLWYVILSILISQMDFHSTYKNPFRISKLTRLHFKQGCVPSVPNLVDFPS